MQVSLFKPQIRVMQGAHAATITEIIALCGRGSGKSWVAAHLANLLTLSNTGRGAIVAPTLGQAQELVNYLKPLLEQSGEVKYCQKPPVSWKPTIVDFRNVLSFYTPEIGFRAIYVCSCDNKSYENARGKTLGWWIVDEAALVPEAVIDDVLQPALRGQGPNARYVKALFTSPRGSANWVSRRALTPRDYRLVVRAPSSANFIDYPPHRVEQLKREMPERSFRQEILGDIVDTSNSSQIHVTVPWRKREPHDGVTWWLTLDQNVSPMAGLIAFTDETGMHIHRELCVEDSAVAADMVAQVRRALPPCRIHLAGDSSGNARNVVERQTFYKKISSLLRTAGYTVVDRTLRSNPSVFDSCEMVCERMVANRLTVDPGCSRLKLDFQLARYTPELQTDKAFHDPHFCFAPETQVRMGDGSARRIDALQPGDVVDTPLGPQPVLAAGITARNAGVINIAVGGNDPIRVTGDHRVLTPGHRGYNVAPIAVAPVAITNPIPGGSNVAQTLSHVGTPLETTVIPAVYCISVPCGWFILANGLIVKNCDSLRYLVWATRPNQGGQPLALAGFG